VPRTRRQRTIRGLLLGAPVVVGTGLVGLLIAAQVADDRAGCGSIDPTDAANYSEVAILNDTGSPVVVSDCEGTECQLDHVPSQLGPGERFDDHAACAASGGDMTSWRIASTDGKLVGYIAVDTPRKTDGLVFLVSRASRDRRTPSPSR
jgi:hypothetical protein